MKNIETTQESNPIINPLGYICQLYTEGRLADISDEEVAKLFDDLNAFDKKLERPGEIADLEYLISEGYTFPETFVGMADGLIPNISHGDGQYQKNTTLGADHTITDDRRVNDDPQPLNGVSLDPVEELKLAYAKRKIFAFMRENPNLNSTLHDTVEGCIHVSDFFVRKLRELCTQYPETYTSTDYRFYTDAHTPEELLEKIQDTKRRFIRYEKDDSGGIVAYFESKQSSTYPDTQVVQWIFVSEKAQKKGFARQMWKDFEKWCKENGYKSIWSYVALRNTVSQEVHERLMPQSMRGWHDSNTYVYTQSVPEK